MKITVARPFPDERVRDFEGECLITKVDGDGELYVYGGPEGTTPVAVCARGSWETVVASDVPAGDAGKRWAARQRAVWEG